MISSRSRLTHSRADNVFQDFGVEEEHDRLLTPADALVPGSQSPAEEEVGQVAVETAPLVFAVQQPPAAQANEPALNFKLFRSKARQGQQPACIVRVHDPVLTPAQMAHRARVQRCVQSAGLALRTRAFPWQQCAEKHHR
jgi:hypothetical protein